MARAVSRKAEAEARGLCVQMMVDLSTLSGRLAVARTNQPDRPAEFVGLREQVDEVRGKLRALLKAFNARALRRVPRSVV